MTPSPRSRPEPQWGARRILYIDFAPEPGGSIQSLLLLLRHLPRQDYEPLVLLAPAVARLPAWAELDLPVFSYDAGQGTAIPFRAGTRQVRVSATAARVRDHPWLGPIWQSGSIGRRLWYRTRHTARFIAEIIDQQRIDLVHLNDALPLAEPGILAAWRRHRPSIVTVRSFTPLDPFHRLLSRLPAVGVFTSAALRQDQHRQGARFRRERIIANAIDLSQYAPPSDLAALRAEVRAELGLSPTARIAIVVGRIMRRKGVDAFIQAIAAARSNHPDLIGLIVGPVDRLETGLDDDLRKLAQDSGIADRIHFAGYRADIPRLLLASDLLCFVPTDPEPFGRTLIEGMAAGLPVIGARNGAIPDILIEGETGLLVPPAAPPALAAALHTLLADPASAQSMGQAGRCRAAAHFSIARQIADLCALYAEIR